MLQLISPLMDLFSTLTPYKITRLRPEISASLKTDKQVIRARDHPCRCSSSAGPVGQAFRGLCNKSLPSNHRGRGVSGKKMLYRIVQCNDSSSGLPHWLRSQPQVTQLTLLHSCAVSERVCDKQSRDLMRSHRLCLLPSCPLENSKIVHYLEISAFL